MSGADKAVVRRFIAEVWNAGRVDLAEELVDPGYDVGGDVQGPEAVKRNVAFYRTAFPDLECRIEQLIAEDGWVAARLMLHGTHLGPLAGIPPTGRRVSMKEMVIWRVAGGKLVAIWSVGDALGLRIQLGAIPASAWDQPVSGKGCGRG